MSSPISTLISGVAKLLGRAAKISADLRVSADRISSNGSKTDDDDDYDKDDNDNTSQDKDTELAQELHLAKSKNEALSNELKCTQDKLKVELKEKDQLPNDLLLLEETVLEGDAATAAAAAMEYEIKQLCKIFKVTQHENEILMQDLNIFQRAAIE